MKFDEQLENAKLSLIIDYDSIFITTVLFNLIVEEDSSIPTACTNGTFIKINKEFFGSLSLKERVFLLAHETWHVCFNHMSRREDRDPKNWNIAGDYVINLMLVQAGYSMIMGGCLDYQYKDMSTEEVYDALPEDAEPDEQLGGDIVEPSEDKKEELTQRITDIVVQATTQAEMQNQYGSIPNSITRMVQDILYPELPYGTLLDKYFNERNQDDYTWSKRNRRYPDVYLPTLYSESMGEIAIYIDASGSVTDEQFAEYIALMLATKERYKPSKMTIVDFDTDLKEVIELTSTDSGKDIVFTGGGGTNYKPVLDHINNNKAEVSIIITDGYARHYVPKGFDKDVIWLIDNNKDFTYPIGHIININ